MVSEQSDDGTAPKPLAPGEITERFDDLEAGDEFSVNHRDLTYEVVETDTYSVVAEDQHGRRVTVSQNLQSGGWSVNEEVFHVDVRTE